MLLSWHGLRYQLPILQVLANGHSQLVMQPRLHDKKQAPIFFILVSNERKARQEICSPCCSYRLRLSSDEQPSALCNLRTSEGDFGIESCCVVGGKDAPSNTQCLRVSVMREASGRTHRSAQETLSYLCCAVAAKQTLRVSCNFAGLEAFFLPLYMRELRSKHYLS